MTMQRHQVLDFPVDVAEPAQYLPRHQQLLQSQSQVHGVTLNPEMIMQGLDSPDLAKLLKQADLILPDGAGVVWALRRHGVAVSRIAGIEFAQQLLADAAKNGYGVALVGASPEVNDHVAQQLPQHHPGLIIAYAHHGFFTSPDHEYAVAKACADTHPRYVFVALGVPRQEHWIEQYKGLFDGPVAFWGVGGSFDVWSGLKQRAHPLFIRLNCEWLWRLLCEPWRFQRMAKTLPAFVIKVLGTKVPSETS